MSETISNMPSGTQGFLSDIVPLTQGSSGPGSGTSRGLTTARLLGSNGLIFAGDPEWVGGVKADGVTDDTNAWIAAMTTAATTGAYVMAPIGVSVISAFTMPSNVAIIGRSVTSFTGAGSTTLGSVIKPNSATAPGIIMSSFSQLYNMQIVGNSAQPCIRMANGAVQLFDVTCLTGSVGMDFNFTGGESLIANCRIHECGIGISNSFGAQITGSVISNCSNHGIALGQGCNHNVIVGNRIEWSANDNIHMDGTGSFLRHNVITGNSIDAAGKNNVSMRICRETSVTGNTLTRASRNASGGSIGTIADANIMIAGSTGVSVTGNVSAVGQNDGNTGYMGPYYAIWDDGGNVSSIFSGNVLACHNNSATLPVPPIAINTTTTFNALTPYNVVYWA